MPRLSTGKKPRFAGETDRRSAAEKSFDRFGEILDTGKVSWRNFQGFFRMPGLVEKALDVLVDTNFFSTFRGFEVLDEPLAYSLNFTLKGERLYFTQPEDIVKFVGYLETTGYGEGMRKLVPEGYNRTRMGAGEIPAFSTFLPVSIRKVPAPA
jgi:hypothetical protein